ncbi:hypothetical protein [Photobacterium leiognathi]|uniref:hypothetical protein n=1 Tax=Photobacterium leiognathi TaxID=553611 RepID=UPI002980D802|nr:hypothetical protein [Photobacterium leiognathi]
MELITALIKEINSKPTHEDCATCVGKGVVLSTGWQSFIDKYGKDALERGTKFDRVESLWLDMVNNARYDALPKKRQFMKSMVTDQQLLTENEANDFFDLYLSQPDQEECSECDGEKIVITAHGELVQELRTALNK